MHSTNPFCLPLNKFSTLPTSTHDIALHPGSLLFNVMSTHSRVIKRGQGKLFFPSFSFACSFVVLSEVDASCILVHQSRHIYTVLYFHWSFRYQHSSLVPSPVTLNSYLISFHYLFFFVPTHCPSSVFRWDHLS